MLKALVKNRIFQIDIILVEIQCLKVVDSTKECWLWHSRFVHFEL